MPEQYVKYISKYEILPAPKNYEGILNFNTNIDLMLEKGFKPLHKAERPTDDTIYTVSYKRYAKYIQEVIITETEEHKAERHKKEFEEKFMETSYEKDGVKGWLRQIPRGYSDVATAMSIINSIIVAQGQLTPQVASMIIFYEAPDFTKPEECTEEWLIEHQFNPGTMTIQEWTLLYADIQQRWSMLNYMKAQMEE